MAIPVAAIAKAAVAVLSDERGRKVIGGIIAAILSPIVLMIVVVVSTLSAAAGHNNVAMELCFNGSSAPSSLPGEYRQHISEMQTGFARLADTLAVIRQDCAFEDGEPDMLRIRAVFYALFFGSDSPQTHADRAFLDCFLTYETRTRPCTQSGHHDEDTDCEETYIAAIPIADLPTIYQHVGALAGRTITSEDAANIAELYYRVGNGIYTSQPPDSLEGGANGTHARITELIVEDDVSCVGGDFASPIAGGWRGLVSCEFGTGYVGHTGMDIAIPAGTEVRAVAAGKVLYTRINSSGYGYHAVINHGGGIVTLYAHNSRILVSEGQSVAQGQVIALSGSTGNSSGPHLHVEFIVDGAPQNPRSYLP